MFINPKTNKPYTDLKKAFGTASPLAGIHGLHWHDCVTTFGIRVARAIKIGSSFGRRERHRRVKDLFQVFPVWVGHILQRDSVQTSWTRSTWPVRSAPSLLTIQ